MFRRSVLMVFTILALVFASAFTTQMVLSSSLPSAYDPGLTIEKAFQTSKHPLLVEFYTDTCGTCRKVTPMLHEVYQAHHNQLTLVMLNLEEEDNKNIAQLFGVEELPSIYVFDFKHMKKHQISPKDYQTKEKLAKAIEQWLS